MAKYNAVLIDLVSIQQYVFASSKIKENLGASYLLKAVYEDPLIKTKPLLKPKGYIGGGNALLFFVDYSDAKKFVEEWTSKLMVEFPGITASFAIDQIEFTDDSDNKFMDGKNKLFEQLAVNKYRYHPQVIIPTHGLTAPCARTGLSMDSWINAGDEKGYYSSTLKAKNDAVDIATHKMNSDFPCVSENGFEFTNELDKLGSSRGQDSHIAIVHIDGNGMGNRFKECVTLKDVRDLSESLESATKCSFTDLLIYVMNNYNKFEKENIKTYPTADNKKIIPIRPIILGGDDVTFVCDGRLGIHFAQIFLEFFMSKSVSDNKTISACAGVAITKLKYPFYRGYTLSEELCRSAKTKRKEFGNNGSWIDWHISYGGFSGSLEDIREQYKVTQGNLLMRPYKLIRGDSEISFYNLLDNTKQFFKKENGKQKFPNSKIKELREVLTQSADISKLFKQSLDARRLDLPNFNSATISDQLFINDKTPFYDMIELTELYPKFEIEKEVQNAII